MALVVDEVCTCVHIHVHMDDDHRDHNVADNGNLTMSMMTYPCTRIHVAPAGRDLAQVLAAHSKVIVQPWTSQRVPLGFTIFTCLVLAISEILGARQRFWPA